MQIYVYIYVYKYTYIRIYIYIYIYIYMYIYVCTYKCKYVYVRDGAGGRGHLRALPGLLSRFLSVSLFFSLSLSIYTYIYIYVYIYIYIYLSLFLPLPAPPSHPFFRVRACCFTRYHSVALPLSAAECACERCQVMLSQNGTHPSAVSHTVLYDRFNKCQLASRN